MTKDEQHAARRREILAAAENVFSARGYAAARVEEVAAAARVAKGSVYNYFKNKQDLFTQVFDEAMASDEARVEAILESPLSPTEKLNSVLDLWTDRLGHIKHYGGLMLEFWATAARQDETGSLAGVFRELYRRWQSRLSRIVREGVSAGEFAPEVNVERASSLIMALTDGLLVQLILGMEVDVDAEMVAAMKRSILAGLSGGVSRA